MTENLSNKIATWGNCRLTPWMQADDRLMGHRSRSLDPGGGLENLGRVRSPGPPWTEAATIPID